MTGIYQGKTGNRQAPRLLTEYLSARIQAIVRHSQTGIPEPLEALNRVSVAPSGVIDMTVQPAH